jgi:hypothetical protein
MGFGALQAGSNALADGIREPLKKEDDPEWKSQAIKGGIRTGLRTGAQAVKTTVSIAQSAGEGKLGGRSIPGDFIRAGMAGGAGGIVKEGLGSAFQMAADYLAPPDEKVAKSVTKALNKASDLARSLNAIEAEGKSAIRQDLLQELRAPVMETFVRIYGANALKIDQPAFADAFGMFAQDIDRTIEKQTAAWGGKTPLEDIELKPMSRNRPEVEAQSPSRNRPELPV